MVITQKFQVRNLDEFGSKRLRILERAAIPMMLCDLLVKVFGKNRDSSLVERGIARLVKVESKIGRSDLDTTVPLTIEEKPFTFVHWHVDPIDLIEAL